MPKHAKRRYTRSMRYALLVGLVILAPLFAFAQNMTSTDPFTLSVTPLYPAPNSLVTISALSASIDLANATMDVSANGTSIYKGSVRTIDVPVGGAGVLTSVRVVITSNGVSASQTVSVRPEDVVLISEPLATAPVLYPGKALEPLGGSVRIVAMAGFKDGSGTMLDSAQLSYAWTVDNSMQANMSGIGKSAIVVATPLQYRNRSVSVVVQSQNGSFVSGASLSLAPHDPIVRIYENDPLLGIRFDRALASSYSIADAESSLYAALYSFPTGVGAPVINWYLNGASAQTGTMITLRPTGSGKGSASLSLVAAIGDAVRATQSLQISFGAKSSTNFLGL